MNRLNLMASGLFVAVFISAIAVIYVKQQSRDLYSEIRALQKQQDNLAIEWGRLLIQHGTLVNHARVERIARKQLNMVAVEQPRYVVLP